MTSLFRQVAEAVNESLVAAQSDVATAIGRKGLVNFKQIPRVVWVCSGGSVIETDRPGTTKALSSETGGKLELYRDQLAVDCHVVAKDLDDLFALRDLVLEHARAMVGQRSSPGQYVIPTQIEGGKALVNVDAEYLIQQFTWDLPVCTSDAESLTAIGTFSHTCAIDLTLTNP